MGTLLILSGSSPLTRLAQIQPQSLASGTGPEAAGISAIGFDPTAAEWERRQYKVQLWDEAKQAVEQVLALALDSQIGFAAYYAAGREFSDRYVTLRHNNRIVSQWNPPGQ